MYLPVTKPTAVFGQENKTKGEVCLFCINAFRFTVRSRFRFYSTRSRTKATLVLKPRQDWLTYLTQTNTHLTSAYNYIVYEYSVRSTEYSIHAFLPPGHEELPPRISVRGGHCQIVSLGLWRCVGAKPDGTPASDDAAR